jgi:hypothetical protein
MAVTAEKCNHIAINCINPFEIIRKYKCKFCGEVMMCDCDQEFGRRFLPHQLRYGKELKTQDKVEVTLGFQKNICNKCRGLPEESNPKAPRHGRTSKILMYYWREIYVETTRRFGDWVEKNGTEHNKGNSRFKYKDKYEQIEKEVIDEIKKLHELSPKYMYQRESQEEVILKFDS